MATMERPPVVDTERASMTQSDRSFNSDSKKLATFLDSQTFVWRYYHDNPIWDALIRTVRGACWILRHENLCVMIQYRDLTRDASIRTVRNLLDCKLRKQDYGKFCLRIWNGDLSWDRSLSGPRSPVTPRNMKAEAMAEAHKQRVESEVSSYLLAETRKIEARIATSEVYESSLLIRV